MTISPEFALAAALTTAAGAVMMRLGFGSRALKTRLQGRRCVSCGRRIDANTCPNCSR
jgi:hypothetical protein